MNGRFEVPREFSAEDDKYFKIFTLSSLIVLMVLIFITVVICKFASMFMSNVIPVAVVCLIITAIITGTTMIPIPTDNYMGGGGNTVSGYLIKRYIRKKNACVYVKGYNQYLYDSESAYLVQEMLNKDDSILKYKPRESE